MNRVMNQTFFLKTLYPLCLFLIICLSYLNHTVYQMRAALGLVSGIVLSLIFSNPYEKWTRKRVSTILTWSVVGLGFGMNLLVIAKVGMEGIGYTFLSLCFCILMGLMMGRFLGNSRETSVLISCGTAICGGSAIAAIAPVIRAKEHEISVALVVIFILNAIALLIFPSIGHYFGLTEHQFGLWSALAIHDTSSVVGATLQYGEQALETGTTVKLARALWIVPMAFTLGLIYARFVFHKEEFKDNPPKKPWFILGFLLAAALVTFIPYLQTMGNYIRMLAEWGLVFALFCIGSNLSRHALMQVGVKPFIQGFCLWCVIGLTTLVVILKW